ncbi:MAG: hypothetical protein K6A80_06215 [Saccharofermentans sp.]|nr:hypothetical protein [Saccharofermentans sp.]
MRIAKYDSQMQTLLQTELKRIPRWLRITKLKLVIAFIAELALAAVIVLSLNPGDIASGTIFANFRYWYCVIPFASIAPFWFIRACSIKTKAYKTASLLASLYRRPDDYNTNAVYQHKNKSCIPAGFCPDCGLLIVPGECTCRSCAARENRHRLAGIHG